MKLTEEARQNCLVVFEDWAAKVIDHDKFFEAIEDDAELIPVMNSYDGTGYGLDTADREWMMEVVSVYTIGMIWPIYGDTQEYKNQFIEKMKACEVFECVNW